MRHASPILKSPALWILAPLLLALLYAIAWPLFAPRPTLEDVVPSEAVLTMRFKDLAALDRAWYRPKDDPALPHEQIASGLNLSGLPGVDPHRPYHLVYLPRERRQSPSMVILPVSDAGRLRHRFEDASFFLDRGHIRHAQHLEIRGAWAAVGGDREAVRHLGEGGLTARDLGEDQVVAIDVPALARFALLAPWEAPWGTILTALGVDPTKARPGGAVQETELDATRVVRIASAWRTARLWSFFEEHRIRLEIEPTPGTRLADLLHAIAEDPEGEAPLPAPPRQAQAWIRVPGGKERAALAWTLWSAGIAFPEALASAEEPLGAWGRPEGSGWLLLFAVPSIGKGHAWTLGVVAPTGTLPPLAPFHPAFPPEPGTAEVGAGELLLTLADLQHDRTPPAGQIVFARRDDLDVVTLGAAAERAQSLVHTGRERSEDEFEGEGRESGWRTVATFGLAGARAKTLLGDETEMGGLLAALGGGEIRGVLTTDGRILRLDATAAGGP